MIVAPPVAPTRPLVIRQRLQRSVFALAHRLDSMLVRILDERPVNRWPALARAHDALILRHRLRRALGYTPNLRNPRTYNEKLAWRMLHDRNPLLALTTDKLAVRDYVSAKLGADILVPVFGIYERAADIPWDDLPAQFVLKASHGCEMNIIVSDKDAEDRDKVLREADSWLTHSFYRTTREWGYRSIPRRLYIEELLIDEHGQLPYDFKFLVFRGRTAVVRVHINRFGDHRVNFYDPELRLLPVRQVYATDDSYQPPPEVASMAKVAERLAEDFDYARVDLYLVNGEVKFGEITHYDGNATQGFRPAEFDRHLGDLWRLPSHSQVPPMRGDQQEN